MKRFICATTLALLASMALAPAMKSASAAEILYGVTFDNQLITIDTTTGAGTLVGAFGDEAAPFGLGVRNGRLYTWDQVGDPRQVVREIDPLTGAFIDTIDIDSPSFLFAEGDITFGPDGTGYIIEASGPFVSFDLDSGTSSLISSDPGLDNVDGLAFDAAGALFSLVTNINTPDKNVELYLLDPVDGSSTLVGDTGLDSGTSLAGLAFGSGGTLYGVINDMLYTIDSSDASVSLIGSIGFADVSGIRFVPAQVIPEPSTLALCGPAALMGLAAWRWRRRGQVA